MIELESILSIYTAKSVDKFLQHHFKQDLTNSKLTIEDIEGNWMFLGNNSSNSSVIDQLTKGEKGIIERLTNGIDAVLEKEKEEHYIRSNNSSDDIIKKAFPQFYAHRADILSDKKPTKIKTYGTNDKVILAINDGSKSNKPTFDIIDEGIGVKGEQFSNTLLSINQGNKITTDKNYLIGAFGQGGSTSLPFSYATLILSKKDNEIYFTIIKSVNLRNFKNHSYVYLVDDNKKIPHAKIGDIHAILEKTPYLKNFIKSSSGTLVRMIETDISLDLRKNDITKPGMFVDYINTELFNVGMPIKIIENRKTYTKNKKHQNRNAYGSLLKIKSSEKYYKPEFSGTFQIFHNKAPFEIDYYVILPSKEENWGNDQEARNVFRQYNAYEDPVIYTVNGQTIATERYTKFKNRGLSFLKYRLLIVINLDILGSEKYKFFTSNRANIKETDLTKGFFDKVVDEVTKIDRLIELNEIIGNKSLKETVDASIIEDVENKVKNIYTDYLKEVKTEPSSRKYPQSLKNYDDEKVYFEYIKKLEILTKKNCFYKDETLRIKVETQASRYANQQANIDLYIDNKHYYNYDANFMNGQIIFNINPKNILKESHHKLQFIYFNDDLMPKESNTLEFYLHDKPLPKPITKRIQKKLDFKIKERKNAELILDFSKDEKNKKICAYISFDHPLMMQEVFGYKSNQSEILEITKKIISPVILFGLFLDEQYDYIESSDHKNSLVVSYCKSILDIIK